MKSPVAFVVVLAVLLTPLASEAQSLPIPTMGVGFDEVGDKMWKFAQGFEKLPKDKPSEEYLDRMSKFFIYRVDGSPKEREATLKEMEVIANHIRRTYDPTESFIEAVPSYKGPKDFVDRFAPLLAERFKDVFIRAEDVKEKQQTLLYGAQMLPIVASIKHDSIGDYLVTLLAVKGKEEKGKEKEVAKSRSPHPAVQLYAAKAMKEFFPVRKFEAIDVGDEKREAKKRRDIQRVDTLSQFIERNSWPSDKMTDDAIRFVRKEAIASLGEVQVPAVVALAGGKAKAGAVLPSVEGTSVPTLLKVLIKGGLSPDPNLPEKYQAALALCKIDCGKVPGYQPDLGIFLIGNFIAEFATTYNKEITDVAGKKVVATVPWKMYAETLKTQLGILEERTKSTPAAAKAKSLVAGAGPILDKIARHDAIRDEILEFSTTVVRPMRPKTDEVEIFKGLKATTIKLAP